MLRNANSAASASGLFLCVWLRPLVLINPDLTGNTGGGRQAPSKTKRATGLLGVVWFELDRLDMLARKTAN